MHAKDDPPRITQCKPEPDRAWGHCIECSCPGFIGSGYTCDRGGCGHHFDNHGG